MACDASFAGMIVQCPACTERLQLPEKDQWVPEPGEEPVDSGETLEEMRNSFHSGSHRADLTISAYMRERQIEGGVDLSGSTSSRSASDVLEADQGKKYNLGNEISRGGMGAILGAKDVNLRRSVAMKVMLDPHLASDEEVMRFIEEAQVTSQLQHPGIMPIYELGIDAGGNVFYTMKYISGITLKDVIEKLQAGDSETESQYPLSRLLTIFQRICDAMAYAHAEGVIHRDLKPENIIIGDFGEVLVLDWGLAKVLGKDPAPSSIREPGTSQPTIHRVQRPGSVSSARRDLSITDDFMQTMVGDVMGTPSFMAPEQAKGDVDQIDARTDLFALGAILYNILTKERPITGETLDEILENATYARFVPAQEVDPTIPDSLAAICKKAMARRPEKRYRDVTALQKDITAYQNGFATSAEDVNTWKQVKLFVKRNKPVCATAGALLLILVVALSAYTGVNIKQRRVAEQALSNLAQTAPTFMALAEEQIAAQKFDDALANIDHAISIAPENASYHARKGDILQTTLDLGGAVEAYSTAMLYDKSLPFLTENLKISREIHKADARRRKPQPKNIKRLSDAMRKQERYVELLAVSQHLKDSVAVLSDTLGRMLKKARIDSKRLIVRADGTVSLNLNGTDIANLNSLRGLPLTSLNIAGCRKVQDLSPLKGMPLTSLQIHECDKIKDLTPLKGMRLKSLHMWETAVSDLSPLEGMPLKSLYLQGNNRPAAAVTDISALQSCPLETLALRPESITAGFAELRRVRSLKTVNGEPGSQILGTP